MTDPTKKKNGWKKTLYAVGITVAVLGFLATLFFKSTGFFGRFFLVEAAGIRNEFRLNDHGSRLNKVEVDIASIKAGTDSANTKLDTILRELEE